MSSYLAYSYSKRLPDHQSTEINKSVNKNRAEIYKTFCKISLIFVSAINAIPVNLPQPIRESVILTAPISRNIYRRNDFELMGKKSKEIPQSVPMIYSKSDKIMIEDDQEELSINNEFYPYILIDKSILDIRGGNKWIDFLVCLSVLAFLIHNDLIEGFQPNPNAPIRINIDGVKQKPERQFNYNNGGLKDDFSSNPRLNNRVLSNNYDSTKDSIQATKFVKNGVEIDLHKAYNEVLRRADKLNCSDFNCSFERFIQLCIEDGDVDLGTIREAITCLQGEMLGYYSNAKRAFYGDGVKGIDFVVEGKGPLKHITHLELKNPTSVSLRRSESKTTPDAVKKEGIRIAERLINQITKWCNIKKLDKSLQKKIHPNHQMPTHPRHVLSIVDFYDVQRPQIKGIIESILSSLKKKGNIQIRFINTGKKI